jgi:hypothetical protein
MAMGPLVLFAKNLDKTDIATLIGETVKIALLDDGYVPNATATGHSIWADMSTNELANGDGYTTGGFSLTTLAQGATAGNDGFYFDSDDAVWAATGGGLLAWNSYVIYVLGTQWGIVNPVIGYAYGVAGGASDVAATSAGNNLTITAPATGWFDRTQG